MSNTPITNTSEQAKVPPGEAWMWGGGPNPYESILPKESNPQTTEQTTAKTDPQKDLLRKKLFTYGMQVMSDLRMDMDTDVAIGFSDPENWRPGSKEEITGPNFWSPLAHTNEFVNGLVKIVQDLVQDAAEAERLLQSRTEDSAPSPVAHLQHRRTEL